MLKNVTLSALIVFALVGTSWAIDKEELQQQREKIKDDVKICKTEGLTLPVSAIIALENERSSAKEFRRLFDDIEGCVCKTALDTTAFEKSKPIVCQCTTEKIDIKE